MLKKLPCVSFAGVDSLDDVKNHTYNELFVSGGFIVSDESILNPEVITIGKIHSLKHATTFLMYCSFCQSQVMTIIFWNVYYYRFVCRSFTL